MKDQFLHYNTQEGGSDGGKHDYSPVKNHLDNGRKAFVIVYMVGCPPCEATLPEWDKIEQEHHEKIPEEAMVVKVNRELKDDLAKELQMEEIANISSFPTIAMIEKNKPLSPYQGERNASDFAGWIQKSVGNSIAQEEKEEQEKEENIQYDIQETPMEEKITEEQEKTMKKRKRRPSKTTKKKQRGGKAKARTTRRASAKTAKNVVKPFKKNVLFPKKVSRIDLARKQNK